MGTMRESIENVFAAMAFAEHDLAADAVFLRRGEKARAVILTQRPAAQKSQRPRPTLHAK